MSKYANLFTSAQQADRDVRFTAQAAAEEGFPDTGRFTLLFVDDEENVLNALRRIFIEENYEILTARSGDEALKIMEARPTQLVISDHRMPGMTGAELLREIKDKWPQTIRIMLTGYADVQSIMGAVNEGAVYKFITKPWNDEDLRITVSLALQQYVLLKENRKLREISKEQALKLKNYSNLFDEDRGLLGKILLKAGVVNAAQLESAQKAKNRDEFFGDALVRLGLTSENKIVHELQKNQNLPVLDLKETQINPAVVKILQRGLCAKNRLIPIKLEGGNLTIAMADPSDIIKVDNIAMLTGFKVLPVIAKSSDIAAVLTKVYGDSTGEEEIADIEEQMEAEPVEEIDIVIEDDEASENLQELMTASGVPPIIRIVNAVVLEALRLKASDIHIEPKTKYTIVRYRIDGMLYTKLKVPSQLHTAVISRIKILAKMDISEKRKPQDGRITIKTSERVVDVRVSSMPTINGEKVVMRVLDKTAAVKKISELGMLADDLKRLDVVIKKPQGIVISTGPTGSGKTTMLYSMLYEMLKSTKNYETIEDPVEYFLEDANQVYVKDKIGLSFASVLRATLRQDPDVILVGEIRDHETADVAFKAALTGHMVLTSLHTNNTVASITRLMDIGVKPYLIASALDGIIAQRLVRRVCSECKTDITPDKDIIELLNIPADSLKLVTQGTGCAKCGNTGYSGRTGIFELFVMNDEFRHMISTDYRESELLNLSRLGGMRTLIEDGIEKVRSGITTLEELLRVVGPPTKYERRCERCSNMVDIKFLFCPYCGAFKHNICVSCRMPLEQAWLVCPFCGTSRNNSDDK
ncbi:MAG: response regulator [Nitrospirae bacterium]|nr:MAG: response regulator [Nitrospirota bacterium]